MPDETWDDVKPPPRGRLHVGGTHPEISRSKLLAASLTHELKEMMKDGGYRLAADNIRLILSDDRHPHFVNLLKMSWDRLEGKVADKLDLNVAQIREGIVLRHGRLDAPLPLPGGGPAQLDSPSDVVSVDAEDEVALSYELNGSADVPVADLKHLDAAHVESEVQHLDHVPDSDSSAVDQ